MTKNQKVPASEISRQLEIAGKVKSILPAGRKYHIVTLGWVCFRVQRSHSAAPPSIL